MNGKRAKLLRKLAGPKQDTTYTVDKRTARRKFMNTTPLLDFHGNPQLDDDDKPMFNKIEWNTATIMMGAGTRMVYKVLKNIYHNRTRDLPVNIHTPVGA